MKINIVIISANIIHILICFFNDKYAWAHTHNSTAAKGYDCALCDKSTTIGTLVVIYIYKLI